MEYTYSLLDPTGNITVLVRTPVPVSEQPRLAEAIMAAEPTAQQTGFVGTDKSGSPTLRMAGGEFCGNASLSAAALFCMQHNLPVGETKALPLHVPGVDLIVPVTVTRLGKESFRGTVKMPTPCRVEPCTLQGRSRAYEGTLVTMSGISHFVTREPMEREEAEANIKNWCQQRQADGFGIMLFEESSLNVTPLVYVPVPETMFWESSCASGSTAVAAALAAKRPFPFSVTLHEPGGDLTVAVNAEGEFHLTGQVRLIKQSTFTE